MLHAVGKSHSKSFVQRLLWRDLAYFQLHTFPSLPTESVRRHYDEMPWDDDPEKLVAWQKGRTGYPLVDAGMRELWATGFMHQNVRMVCASFLVEALNMDWRVGHRCVLPHVPSPLQDNLRFSLPEACIAITTTTSKKHSDLPSPQTCTSVGSPLTHAASHQLPWFCTFHLTSCVADTPHSISFISTTTFPGRGDAAKQ